MPGTTCSALVCNSLPKLKERDLAQVAIRSRDVSRMLFQSENPIPDKTCARQCGALRKLLLSADEFMQLLKDC